MNVTRETLYQALFDRFSKAAAFKLAGRKLVHWSDVLGEDCPAFFQRQVSESYVRQRGLPPKVELRLEHYVYVQTLAQQTDDVVPSTMVNEILDSYEALMQPDDVAANVLTLGGLVHHCWVSGAVEIFEGVLGDQAVAIIPISVLVPA